MLKGLYLSTAVALCCAELAIGMPAAAQESSGGAAAASEDIVVTARRRVERLQDVPVPVTAMDSKAIESAGIRSIESLGTVVPALNVGQSQLGAGGLIYLRGVGSGTGNPLIDQSVSVNIDSVAMASASLMFAGQYDVQRVEVLRGPQSLFFGKNSPGGVISFTSKDPGDEFEFELGGGYEFEAQEKYATAIISGPITDEIGARVFLKYGEQRGYYDVIGVPTPTTTALGVALPTTAEGYPDSTDLFVRGTLTYDPSDNFNVRAKVSHSHRKLDSYPIGWQRVFCPLGSPNIGGIPIAVSNPAINIDDCKLDNKFVAGDMTPAEIALFTIPGLDANGQRDVEILLASIEMNYTFGENLTLTSVTGLYTVEDLAHQDQSALPTSQLPTASLVENRQFTQEFRLTSDWEGPINFLAGGLYEKRHATSVNELPAVNRWETAIQDQWAYSFFAQIQWDIIEQVELSVGARYTHEEKKISAFRQRPVYTQVNFRGRDQISFNDLSPEVTLSYRPSDTLMFYGSFKEGYKSGGYDASGGFSTRVINGFSNIYNPEHAEGYEIGLKTELFDKELTLNASVYSYEYENLQVTSFDSVAVSVITSNAAGAAVDGFELDFAWRPPAIEGLVVRGAGAFMDGRYTDFVSDCYTGQSIAAGCDVDVVAGGAREGQDLTGRRILQAPKFSGSIGLAYETLIADGSLRLSLTSDLKYSTRYATQQQQLPGTEQAAYYMYNVSLALADPDDAWEVSLVGRNLNDEVIGFIGQSVPLSGARTGTTTAVQSDALAIMAERGRVVMLQFKIRPADLFGG